MKSGDLKKELDAFLEKHPETRFMETLIADMNGILRGKRVGNDTCISSRCNAVSGLSCFNSIPIKSRRS